MAQLILFLEVETKMNLKHHHNHQLWTQLTGQIKGESAKEMLRKQVIASDN